MIFALGGMSFLSKIAKSWSFRFTSVFLVFKMYRVEVLPKSWFMFDIKCFFLFTSKQYNFAMIIGQKFPDSGTFTAKLPSIKM